VAGAWGVAVVELHDEGALWLLRLLRLLRLCGCVCVRMVDSEDVDDIGCQTPIESRRWSASIDAFDLPQSIQGHATIIG